MNASFEQTLVDVWRQVLVENATVVKLGGKRYPVRITPKKGLRQVDFIFDGNEIRGLEQNPDTKSRWAVLARSGKVTVRYTDDTGKERVLTERLKLPPDVANGLVFTLLKDIEPSVPQTTVSYVAATPKPRLVHLEIVPQDQVPFSIGSYP
jgi:hypothetical protein